MSRKQIYTIALISAALVSVAIFISVYFRLYAAPNEYKPAETAYWFVEEEYDQQVHLLVARTDEQLRKGVGGWISMTEHSDNPEKPQEIGMLFELGTLQIPTFWMKDVDIALDMIWLNDDTIVDITTQVQPEPGVSDKQLQRYSPNTEANRVIEVRGGFVQTYGVEVGDTIDIIFFEKNLDS